jgi:hypothetical protein
MSRIIIVPSHPFDYEDADIKELIDVIKHDLPKDLDVEYNPAELMRKGMYGVTFWQFIKIYLEDVPAEIRGAIIAKLVDAGIAVIRKVLRKRKNNIRPNGVFIYDENKNKVASAMISNARQKPRTEEEFQKWTSDKYNKKKKKIQRKRKNKAQNAANIGFAIWWLRTSADQINNIQLLI